MLFSPRESLEDKLIERALIGPATIKDLHEELRKGEKHLTLRAVYKSVDKLLAAGVLLKPGKHVFLNEEWVREVRDKLSLYKIPTLSKGERAAYTFVSVAHLDAFWTTIALQLEEENGREEMFFYNPHNFWAYVPERKAAEDKYYAHFREKGRYGFITVGGESLADMEFKRAYQEEHFQVDARALPALRRTDHITVIGDTVITVRLQRKVAERIDALYATNWPMASLLPELNWIYRAPLHTRFVLENNPLKAKKLKKMLARNFYFKTT